MNQGKILLIAKKIDGVKISQRNGQISITFPLEHLSEFVKIIREEVLKDAGAYPLPDYLYPDSKDWRQATYSGRVEWLHAAYEGAKDLIREYEEMYLRQPQTVDALCKLAEQAAQASDSNG